MTIKELEWVEKFKDLSLGVELHVDHISFSKLTITNCFLEMIKKKKVVGS